ncbi:8-oxo-dGTP diphosphatase MutT [candidate division KSB1 bacterium]|nr:8-oxo-dGTP diphosphatase MutT [candidate division KSB1 bacterium]
MKSRLISEHVEVVAGIIWRHKKILLAQRKMKDSFGGFWEFPGGKLEAGESHEAALVREIKEELNIEIQVHGLVTHFDWMSRQKHYTLSFFNCHYRTGEPQAIDCESWRWVSVAELSAYQILEIDQKVLQLLYTNHPSVLPFD